MAAKGTIVAHTLKMPTDDLADGITVLVDLVQPAFYVEEGLAARQIKNYDDSMGASVVPVQKGKG